MKKKYREVFASLQNLTDYKPSHSAISEILTRGGKPVTPNALSNRFFKDGYLSEEEISLIEDSLGIEFSMFNECVEIPYYDIKGAKEPVLSSIKFDNEFVAKILKQKPENLRIIAAEGDSMEGDNIFEDDILLIDISSVNPLVPGIYLFTAKKEEGVFIKRLYMRPEGLLTVISSNRKYPELVYTQKDMARVGLSIKGRVIKNLSRGL